MLVPDLVFFHFYSVEVQSPWNSAPIIQGGFLLFLEISPRHQSSWQWSQPSHQLRCFELISILTTDKGYLPHGQFIHTAGSSAEHNLLISHPTDLTLNGSTKQASDSLHCTQNWDPYTSALLLKQKTSVSQTLLSHRNTLRSFVEQQFPLGRNLHHRRRLLRGVLRGDETFHPTGKLLKLSK